MNRFTLLTLACVLAMAPGLPAYSGSGRAVAAAAKTTRNTVDYTGDVIYQIVTDRFVDGDPANNPPAPLYSKECILSHLYCGGDWKGIESKIVDGYFAGMGVTALLISVPVDNVMSLVPIASSSYHGYWPRDLKRPNLAFGSMDDFRRLVRVAHAHGIKLMIDFVVNQTSPAHHDDPAFAENARLYDDGKLLVSYEKDPEGMYHHHGETDFSSVEDTQYKTLYNLADMEQQHPVIDTYLKDAIKVWLDAGIDGIRVDTVKHVSLAWQKSWMAAINAHRPVFTAGEWYLPRDEFDPRAFRFANESGLGVLDFTFAQALRTVFRYQDKDMRALDHMLRVTAESYRHPLDQVTFLDNHDQNRILLSSSSTHRRLVEQALVFSLTSRGTPMIYYGTEQYMEGSGHAPINREMMRKFKRDTTAYKLTGRLGALRKDSPAIRFGRQQTRYVSPEVLVYERRFHGDTVLVAINRSATQASRIEGLESSLACKGGAPAAYPDYLAGLMGGDAIRVGCDGKAEPFTLAPGAAAVWVMAGGAAGDVPELGHAAPIMGVAGAEITLDGRYFGARPGRVLFGGKPLDAAAITHWDERQVRFRLPAMAGGRYAVAVERDGRRSDDYGGIEVLSAPPLSLRVVVDGAVAGPGETVHLVGDAPGMGTGSEAAAVGPMYNKVLYRYPSWYTDVDVPAAGELSFRFVRKNAAGAVVARESGAPHRYRAPDAGTALVRVKLRGWTPVTPAAQLA
ncbi:MAG: alpha-amylase family glycosyl hydrolase, partial [Telluria sp.]